MLAFLGSLSVLSISAVFFGGLVIGNGNAPLLGMVLTAIGSGFLGIAYGALIDVARK